MRRRMAERAFTPVAPPPLAGSVAPEAVSCERRRRTRAKGTGEQRRKIHRLGMGFTNYGLKKDSNFLTELRQKQSLMLVHLTVVESCTLRSFPRCTLHRPSQTARGERDAAAAAAAAAAGRRRSISEKGHYLLRHSECCEGSVKGAHSSARGASQNVYRYMGYI